MSPIQRTGAAALIASSFVLGGCVYRHADYDDRARPAGFYEHDERWHHDHDGDRREERREEHREYHY